MKGIIENLAGGERLPPQYCIGRELTTKINKKWWINKQGTIIDKSKKQQHYLQQNKRRKETNEQGDIGIQNI